MLGVQDSEYNAAERHGGGNRQIEFSHPKHNN
jgi:hypothetical protein